MSPSIYESAKATGIRDVFSHFTALLEIARCDPTVASDMKAQIRHPESHVPHNWERVDTAS
jgi:thiamine phosphate synthase YjbQ (UPF0047 family)